MLEISKIQKIEIHEENELPLEKKSISPIWGIWNVDNSWKRWGMLTQQLCHLWIVMMILILPLEM
jgi:hypothetical protein